MTEPTPYHIDVMMNGESNLRGLIARDSGFNNIESGYTISRPQSITPSQEDTRNTRIIVTFQGGEGVLLYWRVDLGNLPNQPIIDISSYDPPFTTTDLQRHLCALYGLSATDIGLSGDVLVTQEWGSPPLNIMIVPTLNSYLYTGVKTVQVVNAPLIDLSEIFIEVENGLAVISGDMLV